MGLTVWLIQGKKGYVGHKIPYPKDSDLKDYWDYGHFCSNHGSGFSKVLNHVFGKDLYWIFGFSCKESCIKNLPVNWIQSKSRAEEALAEVKANHNKLKEELRILALTEKIHPYSKKEITEYIESLERALQIVIKTIDWVLTRRKPDTYHLVFTG